MVGNKLSPTSLGDYPQDHPKQKWKSAFKLYKFVSQQCNSLTVNFLGCSYYISASSTFAEDSSPNVVDDGARHETKLQQHDKMCYSVALCDEVMSNIMYFHRALKQPDTSSCERGLWICGK